MRAAPGSKYGEFEDEASGLKGQDEMGGLMSATLPYVLDSAWYDPTWK